MATDFGTDVSTFPDLDVAFAPLTTSRVVAEAIARRLVTPRGSLVDDKNYGYDLRAQLGAGFTPSTQPTVRAGIEAECRQDERVLSAIADVALDSSKQTMTVRVSLTTADGPFTLVLVITAVGASILQVT